MSPNRAHKASKPAPPPPPVLPSFADLLLPAANASQRGRLMPAPSSGEYTRSLDALGLVLEDDLPGMIAMATQRALATATLALPPGTTSTTGGAFDYTLYTEHLVDVPSDLSFHSIGLASQATEAKLTYVVVPREDPSVFRVAEIRNPTDSPLMPGPVEVYVGGRYILSSHLPLVAPRARFSMGLGVEQGVRCARNTHFREARSGTAVVAMNELHHTITVSLHNQLDRPITAEVRERIPAPAKNAEVAVEEEHVEPAWEPWDQRKVGGRKLCGGRRWKIELAGGETRELAAHYIVKIYANNEIVGGNRREA